MDDILGIFNNMKEVYMKYLDSPFALGDERLSSERRSLLEEEGTIYQYPYIESLPPYESSEKNIIEACKSVGFPAEYGDFIDVGLFKKEFDLHSHQFQAMEHALKEKKHVVVTSGTGSGKTESFLLPLILNILDESKNWEKAGVEKAVWWKKKRSSFVASREHEHRSSGIRGLILYPLNALVEDQLQRLRKALDSDESRKWLDDYRGGNRIHFGRYTGKTPVSGPIKNGKRQEVIQYLKNAEKQEEELQENRDKMLNILAGEDIDEKDKKSIINELMNEKFSDGFIFSVWDKATKEDLKKKIIQRYYEKLATIPRIQGSEMLTRWDMQEYPPDIFITNFSMLNIILTRAIEQDMFDKTKEWLEESEENVFHLILDELHTYRGTAGTEVAYVLKTLLSRLGLHPDSPQLRIIATSASINKEGQKFLEEFFGISKEKFSIIEGDRINENSFKSDGTKNKVNNESFAKFYMLAQNDFSKAVHFLCQKFKQPLDAKENGQLLYNILLDSGILFDFIKHTKKPQSIKSLQELFAPGNNDLNIIGGILFAITHSTNDGKVPLPLREHLFFRNFQGLWACSNSECNQVAEKYRYENRKIGKIYSQPRLKCGCGGKVLDLYYCQNCGEVYLGGYKNHHNHSGQGEYVLSSDFPDLERLNSNVNFNKKYKEYAVYWPTDNEDAISKWKVTFDGKPYQTEKPKLEMSWAKARYQPFKGIVQVDNKSSNSTGFMYVINSKEREKQDAINKMPAFSTRCPNCHTNWAVRKNNKSKDTVDSPKISRSPIRGQRTGFDMVAQVLLEGITREIPNNEKSKLVLFSDSRQDAAKLSAKIEQNHYYDQLRHIVAHAIDDSDPMLEAAKKKLINNESLTENEEQLAKQFELKNSKDYQLLNAYYQGFLDKSIVSDILNQSNGSLKISNLWDKVEFALVQEGCNPAGPLLSFQKDSSGNTWSSLYYWGNMSKVKRNTNLNEDQKEFRSLLLTNMKEQIVSQVLFAQRKRDIESVGIGYLSLDQEFTEQLEKSSGFWTEAVNSSLRILGGARRHNLSGRNESPNPPKILEDFWTEVAKANDIGIEVFREYMMKVLEKTTNVEGYILKTDSLLITLPDQYGYKCSKCGRLHLHYSCGVCTDCYGLLEKCLIEEAVQQDYYRHIVQTPKTKKRFHAEELTGQTDDEETTRRQQLFQSYFSKNDIPMVDEIDMLSVTTTMEAGVDIGSLRIVAMSNMPPQRFNYQQRVGRAGRRGVPLSVSLTLCRGRSHDDWYFFNLDKMTGDEPPQPYIDLKAPKIAQRVLNKEILFYAFTEAMANESFDSGHSVHGEYGLTKEWERHSNIIEEYIKSDRGKDVLNKLLGIITNNTHLTEFQKITIKKFVETELISRITEVSQDQRYSSNALSENLAAAGLLPMFGFPTRVRLLHHDNRYSSMGMNNLNKGTIDRDLEIAISDYSPGSEIVKDKGKHRVVGLAHYWLQGNQVQADSKPLGRIREISICNNCHILLEDSDIFSECPSCKEKVSEESDAIFRKFKISEPLGFRTAWETEDFTDQFEWTSRGAIPKLAQDGVSTEPRKEYGNTLYWNQDGNIYTINDNFGELFTYKKSRNEFEGWIEKQEIERYGWDNKVTNEQETVALSSIKNTEVLILQLNNISPEITINPNVLGVKSGLLSFAFLFRRVATQLLDVDSNEMQIGIRSQVRESDIAGEVFLSDQLINGAGYAKHLAESGQVEKIIEDMADKLNELPILHDHDCDSSCYRCLRTYDNMIYHPILNWRLGLDLAQMMQDSSYIPSLTSKRWENLIEMGIRNLSQMESKGLIQQGRLPIVTFDFVDTKVACLFKHPFWSDEHSFVEDSKESLEGEGFSVKVFDVFDLLHRPEWIIYKLKQTYDEKSENVLFL
jgi:DEAD/DEAH box helicase domain-containing protein